MADTEYVKARMEAAKELEQMHKDEQQDFRGWKFGQWLHVKACDLLVRLRVAHRVLERQRATLDLANFREACFIAAINELRVELGKEAMSVPEAMMEYVDKVVEQIKHPEEDPHGQLLPRELASEDDTKWAGTELEVHLGQ